MEPAEPEQYAALERFDQDPDLAELERLLAEFNLFRLLGLGSAEETHSRILAWLLNPRENHRLGAAFLNRFLAATTDLDRPDADGSAAQVQREWQHTVDGQPGRLDLLIRDEEQRFLCAIENKVYSGEHSGQLTRYRRALENRYPDFTRRYLFLSPWGILAQDAEERKHWQSVDYNLICQLVEETAQDFADTISAEALAFLRQYANVLRRDILDDVEVRDLARTIYERHSAAIDLINRHKPDYQMEVKAILSEVIQEQEGWELERVMLNQKDRHRFFPVEWRDFEAFPTGKRWGQCQAMVLFEFYTLPDSLELHLCYCSTEWESVRAAIDTRFRAFDNLVHWRREYEHDRHYLGFTIAKGILNSSDFESWDAEAARAKIEAYVSAFAQNQYPQIRDAVIECFKEFEVSGQP